ncbi:MAG: 50S ribosomal protein L4, partial [Rhodospirillaceae bacterium]
RGGAAIFGPVVRSHAYNLPKKVRALALRSALSAKAAEGKLVVLDAAALPEAKTKAFADRLEKLGWSSVLIIGGATLDDNLVRAAKNLPGVDVLPQQGINVYDILRRDTLALSKDAVQHLVERLA